MEDKQSELIGYDYRGPASSKVLNDFVEDISKDLGTILSNVSNLKSETSLLANQTYKQSMAFVRKLNSLEERDTGSICKANLSDITVMSYVDLDDEDIDSDNRLVLRQEYGIIMPPVASNNWLSHSDESRRYISDGVEYALEVPIGGESGTVYSVPLNQAIEGLSSTFYERIVVSPGIVPSQSLSIFFSIPETRTGIGYPASNYIQFLPFPLYTTGYKVWYTTDSEPILSIGDTSWNDWPNYIEPIYHNDSYLAELGPIYTSFPTENITAIRVDINQPYYLVDDTNYVYSHGLGNLEVGMIKSTTTEAVAVVRIDKPTGVFTSITGANVTLDNVPVANEADVVATRYEIDASDPSIAYVEITLTPGGVSTGQIPIISEVSIDYV